MKNKLARLPRPTQSAPQPIAPLTEPQQVVAALPFLNEWVAGRLLEAGIKCRVDTKYERSFKAGPIGDGPYFHQLSLRLGGPYEIGRLTVMSSAVDPVHMRGAGALSLEQVESGSSPILDYMVNRLMHTCMRSLQRHIANTAAAGIRAGLAYRCKPCVAHGRLMFTESANGVPRELAFSVADGIPTDWLARVEGWLDEASRMRHTEDALDILGEI